MIQWRFLFRFLSFLTDSFFFRSHKTTTTSLKEPKLKVERIIIKQKNGFNRVGTQTRLASYKCLNRFWFEIRNLINPIQSFFKGKGVVSWCFLQEVSATRGNFGVNDSWNGHKSTMHENSLKTTKKIQITSNFNATNNEPACICNLLLYNFTVSLKIKPVSNQMHLSDPFLNKYE